MVKVLIDVGDIYHKLYRRYKCKLDYEKYLDVIEKRFGEEVVAIAYGSQVKSEAESFIAYLRSIGFEVKYKRPRVFTIDDRVIKQCHWGVDITLEAMRDDHEIYVLGVSSTDYIPLVQELRDRGNYVIIFASGVPRVMHKIADEVIEIPEDLLEEVQDED